MIGLETDHATFVAGLWCQIFLAQFRVTKERKVVIDSLIERKLIQIFSIETLTFWWPLRSIESPLASGLGDAEKRLS